MGYLGSTVAIGGIAGPALGGFIVQMLGWRYIFFINVPIGIIVVGAAAKYLRLPERRAPRFSMDWPGAVSLGLGLAGLLLLLGGVAGRASAMRMLATGLLALGGFAGFIICESRCRDPLLDLGVFRNPRFLLPLLIMLGYFVAGFMLGVIGPFFLEGVMRYRPATVGLVYMTTPVVTAFGAPLCGWLYDRRRSPYFTPCGLAILGFSYLAYGWIAFQPHLALLILLFALNGLGSAVFQSPNNTELLNAVSRDKLAVASSLSATVRNLGMTLGTSLAGLMVALGLRNAGLGGNLLHAAPAMIARISAHVLWTAGGLALVMALIALAGARKREGSGSLAEAEEDWAAAADR